MNIGIRRRLKNPQSKTQQLRDETVVRASNFGPLVLTPLRRLNFLFLCLTPSSFHVQGLRNNGIPLPVLFCYGVRRLGTHLACTYKFPSPYFLWRSGDGDRAGQSVSRTATSTTRRPQIESRASSCHGDIAEPPVLFLACSPERVIFFFFFCASCYLLCGLTMRILSYAIYKTPPLER